MPETTDGWPRVPCLRCGETVIAAYSTTGTPWEMDPVRTAAGKYTLTGTAGYKPTARKPSKQLSFGVRYYARHSEACRTSTIGGAR